MSRFFDRFGYRALVLAMVLSMVLAGILTWAIANAATCTDNPDGSTTCVLVGDIPGHGQLTCGPALSGPTALRNVQRFQTGHQAALVGLDIRSSPAALVRVEWGNRHATNQHVQVAGSADVQITLHDAGIVSVGGPLDLELEVAVICRRGEIAGNLLSAVIVGRFLPVEVFTPGVRAAFGGAGGEGDSGSSSPGPGGASSDSGPGTGVGGAGGEASASDGSGGASSGGGTSDSARR